MPGDAIAAAPAQQPDQRVVSEEDKALAKDWLKRIDAAMSRPAFKEAVAQFEKNRKLLKGSVADGEAKKRMRANLYFANLAMLRPQIYAKDPEFAVTPTKAVPANQLELVQKFGFTAETLLDQVLVTDARLKQKVKRAITGAYACAVGWLKCCWQEDIRRDPAIADRLKDSQDNLQRLKALREELDDPSACSDQDKLIAELQQTIAGMEAQAEVVVSRGPAVDFVMSEDVIVVDEGVRELGDYLRAGAIAHRVWATRRDYRERYGYDPKKATGFKEHAGQMAAQQTADKDAELLQLFEIWDQRSNRVYTVCSGEEGFCCPPQTPDWTGKRWYPFFPVMYNEIDGAFYPLSDVELIEPLVTEYNEQRDDFVSDRRGCLPLNIARKGGKLTEDDLKRVANRRGGELVLIEGPGAGPISDDIWSGSLGTLDPKNYDTSPARADIDQLIGGGDASRGTVLQAKTATEAEILSQGLRGRSAERQDVNEDLLSFLGSYVLQMCLRKMTEAEVQKVAGPDAVWPTLSADEIFGMVMVKVRAGSTGRPDRLQEQDRWTKLQPVIEKTVTAVSELYTQGQVRLAQALIEMLRETLRRFDERIDLDKLLPQAPEEGRIDPTTLLQENQQLKQQMQQLVKELQAAKEEVEKGYVSAAAQIATSQDPAAGAVAFDHVMTALRGQVAPETLGETLPPTPEDPQDATQSAPPIQ